MTYHIVYLSYEDKPGGRNYVGKHSTEDLYDGYLGSFADTSFSPNFRIVLGIYKDSASAVWSEIQWQRVLRVKEDESYANQVYQTSTGFDCTGVRWPEEYRKKQSLIQREVQNRPEVKEKKSRNITKAVNDPAVKSKHREAMQRIGKDPEVQAKKVASKKASGRNPNETESWKTSQRKSQKVSQNRPETKQLKSERIKERMQDPEVRAKIQARANDHNKGRKWYTNGEESSMYFPGEEPSGWRAGRIDPRKKVF